MNTVKISLYIGGECILWIFLLLQHAVNAVQNAKENTKGSVRAVLRQTDMFPNGHSPEDARSMHVQENMTYRFAVYVSRSHVKNCHKSFSGIQILQSICIVCGMNTRKVFEIGRNVHSEKKRGLYKQTA